MTADMLLNEAQQLLAVLDERLKECQQLAHDEVQEYLQEASANQAFFYVSDANGYVRTQQDAAFVAESIYALEETWTGEFVLEDLSAKRDMTRSREMETNTVAQTNVVDSRDVRTEVICPSRATIGMWGTENYGFDLPTELIIPRGGVMRIWNRQTANGLRCALVGRKVYA